MVNGTDKVFTVGTKDSLKQVSIDRLKVVYVLRKKIPRPGLRIPGLCDRNGLLTDLAKIDA